jgi:hypothetical protein
VRTTQPLVCPDVDMCGQLRLAHSVRSRVRGSKTGSQANGDGTQNTKPFLHESPLTGAARRVSALTPPFAGFETGTFYGPDTSTYNPDTIPAGQVRAVGSYRTSPRGGVLNHGMIYLGPVSGQGGSWTKIDVPADGSDTVGGVRACPQDSPDCLVMDTIAHSTMGDLVVGNYDLNLGQGVSGNAFIYNMSTRQWTLLQLGGSLASGTTLYGIWQNCGPGSPNYTLAGGSFAHGSSPHGNMRAFLMNYNERTGVFGTPQFYNYGNTPQLFTHFDGIIAVPGRVQPRDHQLGSGLVHGVRPGHRRRLAFVRPGDVVSHRCRSKPAVFSRRLQHGDRQHRIPEPGDGALCA